MNAVTIDPLTRADLDWLLPLEAACQPMPWQADHFVVCWQPNACQRGWALRCNHSPVGYLVGLWVTDEAHLLNLVVAQPYRRQGFGARLLAHFFAHNQETATFWLEVRADNRPAIGLYERHGFQRVALRKAYYRLPDGQRIDAWVMRKDRTADGSAR
ncbi:ribosomal protein S18-alanine N-acetyltransferase [Hydrogenophilus thermoluteolus]|uniref:ribosomal protein S18-alanine N-acetyltransferase n=1 Tax=Hydrogenophilus thermoluteolus TaxID=297 RepID=UPI003F67C5D7